jgi:hypothetical protein
MRTILSYIKYKSGDLFAFMIIGLVISGCQTTASTNQNSVYLKQYNTPPIYSGSIQSISSPITITFNPFGKAKQTIISKMTVVGSDDPEINNQEVDMPPQTLKFEARNNHEGVLWRINLISNPETNEELEVDVVKSLNGTMKSVTVSSNMSTDRNTLKAYENMFKSAFDIEYNQSLIQGDALFKDYGSVMESISRNMSNSFGYSSEVKFKGTSTVAGQTHYKDRKGVVAFTDGYIWMQDMEAALSAYSIIDVTTGVTLFEESSTIMGSPNESGYIKTIETKEFEFLK